ncbi:MAG: GatB/YqeY domain-containing protein [Candidatus Saccharimonadales bacterium]
MLERLDADIKKALLSGDKSSATTLRSLKSALANARIAKGEDLDEADIMRVLQKEAKQRRESIDSFVAGGRMDQAEAERVELGIIEGYLPDAMPEAELDAVIAQAIADSDATSSTDMGQVMRIVQPQVAGRADGAEVAAKVRAQLQ